LLAVKGASEEASSPSSPLRRDIFSQFIFGKKGHKILPVTRKNHEQIERSNTLLTLLFSGQYSPLCTIRNLRLKPIASALERSCQEESLLYL
jgi:hypothetical protein